MNEKCSGLPWLALVLAMLGLGLAACGGGGSSGGAAVSAGGSTVTTPTAPTTTVSLPGAPILVSAAPADGAAIFSFNVPVSSAGAAITGYTVSCNGGGVSRSGTGTASPITVSGLANGTAYACVATAANAAGTGPESGPLSVTPAASATNVSFDTAAVLCPYAVSAPVILGNGSAATSIASWTCSGAVRSLAGNGIPNHTTGAFPGVGNPNAITSQSISFSAKTNPVQTATTANKGVPGYALNSVKFDPGTAGTCPGVITATTQCNLANGTDVWRIEALGQTAFNFGVDLNNAHVQPNGEYHYHGVPTGLLTNDGNSGQKMTIVGWATDGFPIYGRYGHILATDLTSPLKVMKGSYVLDPTPDSGRPSLSVAPMGSFTSDWNYAAGTGDLDNCNGRFDVTPEFPKGIYHYYITDTYPYIQRCVKGG